MKKIIIAIDGFSSSGKSTLAKDLSRKLGYAYVDTGAMYRAVTLFFLQNNLDWNNPADVQKALAAMNIRFKPSESGNRTILNGKDVEDEIRQMYISQNVSEVAAISEIRRAMVRQQQEMGREGGIVMDGRDIGTVVFPNADLKLFVSASMERRTHRRLAELQAKGEEVNEEEVRKNLVHRDYIDSTREDSPLRQAEDAIVIDNTLLTREQQLQKALQLVEDCIQQPTNN